MKLGFIGAGNMAEALCKGIVAAGVLPEDDIMASDVSETRRDYFAHAAGVSVTGSNEEVVEKYATPGKSPAVLTL